MTDSETNSEPTTDSSAGGEFGAEHSQDDPIEGTAPVADPGEYESTEQSGGQSLDTGVSYDNSGEPEETPNDIEIAQADDKEAQ